MTGLRDAGILIFSGVDIKPGDRDVLFGGIGQDQIGIPVDPRNQVKKQIILIAEHVAAGGQVARIWR